MTEVWCYFFKTSRTISTFNFSTTTTQNLRLFVLSHQNIFPFHLFISYAFLFTPFPIRIYSDLSGVDLGASARVPSPRMTEGTRDQTLRN